MTLPSRCAFHCNLAIILSGTRQNS